MNHACPRCGAQTAPGSAFCRQCGAPLPPVPPGYSYSYQYGPPPGYSYSYQYGPPPPYQPPAAAVEEIDGVSCADIAGFVGKNAPYYIRKFTELDRTHSKTSFNAVVFLLTLLVGPVAGSLWFFHRRLNKIGAILLSVGVATTATGYFLAANTMRQLTDWMNRMAESAGGGLTPDLSGLPVAGSSIPLSLVSFAVGLAAACVFGLLANVWYKNHVVSSIKTMQAEPDGVTPAGLLSRGGTRTGVWVIVLSVYLAAYVALIVLMMSGFFGALDNYIRQIINGSYNHSYYF